MQDPDKYEEFKAESLNIYIERLKELKLPE